MPKGKKFTAAEKHFIEKEAILQKRIKSLMEQVHNLNEALSECKVQNEKFQLENVQLKEWVERLLKYTELEEKDIKAACNKDQQIASLFKTLNMFSGMMNRF